MHRHARAVLSIGTLLVTLGSAAIADEVGRTFVKPSAARKVEVVLYRDEQPDNAMALRVVAKAGTLVVYRGGGDDDGPSLQDMRSAHVQAVDVAGKMQLLRVDFSFRPPEGRIDDEQTDSYFVSLAGKPQIVFETTTRKTVQRSQLCRAAEQTTFTFAPDGNSLTTMTKEEVTPALDDEDAPIDKNCVAHPGQKEQHYALQAGKFERALGNDATNAAAVTNDDD